MSKACGYSVPKLEKNDYEQDRIGQSGGSLSCPNRQRRNQKAWLYIISNDVSNPRAQLELRAFVDVKVQVEPEEFSLFLK